MQRRTVKENNSETGQVKGFFRKVMEKMVYSIFSLHGNQNPKISVLAIVTMPRGVGREGGVCLCDGEKNTLFNFSRIGNVKYLFLGGGKCCIKV